MQVNSLCFTNSIEVTGEKSKANEKEHYNHIMEHVILFGNTKYQLVFIV